MSQNEKKRKNLESSIEEKLAKKSKLEETLEQKLKEKEKKLSQKSESTIEQKLKEMEEKLKEKEAKQQSKIEEKLSKMPTESFQIGNMTMDEDGNIIDSEGNLIRSSRKPVVSSLINLKKQKEETSNQLKLEAPKSLDKFLAYVDSNVKNPKVVRKSRTLNFVEHGKYIQQGEKLRSFQAKLEYKNEHVANSDFKVSSDLMEIEKEQKNFKKETIGNIQLEIGIEDIPSVEWWDALILPNTITNLESEKIEFLEKKVNQNLIEHPIPIKSADPDVDVGPIPMILTEKERKKMRKIQRMEREKEKQKKIQLGLIPTPLPKANLKNFMKVHLNEGTMDPTKLEQKIREQIAARIKNHEDRNLENKLSKEEKFERNKQKASDDASKGIEVTFIKVDEISHPGIKFKINAQAQEKFISGCVLVLKDFCLILAEGGSKSIRKFQDVMLNKVDWNRDLEPPRNPEITEGLKSEPIVTQETKENVEKKVIKSELLWNGIQRQRNFKGFKFIPFEDEEACQDYLKQHSVLHLWEFAKTHINKNI
jgi:U4/U6 small nuclear ribonucleoprotein PRP3